MSQASPRRSSVFDVLPRRHRDLIYTCQAYRWFRTATQTTGLPLCSDWSPSPDYGRGFAHFVRDLELPWSKVAITRYRFSVAPDAVELNPSTVTAKRQGERRKISRRTASNVQLQRLCDHTLRSLRDTGGGDQIAELLLLFSYVCAHESEENRAVRAMRDDGTTPLPLVPIPDSSLSIALGNALTLLAAHTPGSHRNAGFAQLWRSGCFESALVETYQPADRHQTPEGLAETPLVFDITPIGQQHPHVRSDGTLRAEAQNQLAQQIYAAESAGEEEKAQKLRAVFKERQFAAQRWIRTATTQLELLRRQELLAQGVDPDERMRKLITSPQQMPPLLPGGAMTQDEHDRVNKRLYRRQKAREKQDRALERKFQKAKTNTGLLPALFRQFCLLGQVQSLMYPAGNPSLVLLHELPAIRQTLQKAYTRRTYLSKDERQERAPKTAGLVADDAAHAQTLAAALCTDSLRALEQHPALSHYLVDDTQNITAARADHPWSSAAHERRRLYTAWRRQQQQQRPIAERASVVLWPPPLSICTHLAAPGQILLPRPPVLPLSEYQWTFRRHDDAVSPPIQLLERFGSLMQLWLLIDGPWAAAQVDRLLFKQLQVYLSITADGRLAALG